jgi:hypothetical protein
MKRGDGREKSELGRGGRWGKEERGREAGKDEGIYTFGRSHGVH